MKNTFIKFASVAVVALSLVQTVSATMIGTPITGTIGFTGRVTLNTGSAATATQVSSWVNPVVQGTSGSFVGITNGTPVTIVQPWNFNSGAVANFWSVGGFTFNLISSSITSQGGTPGSSAFVNASGYGTVTDGNPADTATILWNFSTQDPSIAGVEVPTFTFSSSHVTVPDGASTVALLGFALTGASLLRKKFAA